MKKIILLFAIATLVFACNKNDAESALPIKQKISANKDNLPIANVTETGEIELLFLQKDVQEIFNKEFSNLELLYVDVYDESPLKENSVVALQFQIQDSKNGIRETSVEFSIYKKDGVYYTPATNLAYAGGVSVTCSSNCSGEKGCIPTQSGSTWTCSHSTCGNCTKTTSTSNFTLVQFVRLAVLDRLSMSY